MYVRNVLTAGMYVMPVPVGIPISLQYSTKGNLEKVLLGLGDETEDITKLVIDSIRAASIVPVHITISGGTTWVKGVLYTSIRVYNSGKLPEAILEPLLQMFVADPSKFNFFAGNIHSLATQFRGASPIRNWLSMNKFNVLPGWIASANMTKDKYVSLVKRPENTFPYQLTIGYITYDKDGYRFISSDESQSTCTNVRQFLDDNGYVMAEVSFDDETKSIFNWSDVVLNNIQPGVTVVFDKYHKIVYSMTDKGRVDIVSNQIVCPCCGNIYTVSEFGPISCTDLECPSLQFNRLNRLLRALKLMEVTRELYDAMIKNNKLFSLVDIFDSELYSQCKCEIALPDLIHSFIPVEAVVDKETIVKFCNKCNNSIESVCYYLSRPDRILSDSASLTAGLSNFANWLSRGVNSSDLMNLLSCNNIKITSTKAKFDGAPIFRGKRICLTGRFVHGDYSEIEAILKSYSAQVTTTFDDTCHLLLIGGTKEDIRTKFVNQAHVLNVPIMDEHVFFQEYQIDDDISSNL